MVSLVPWAAMVRGRQVVWAAVVVALALAVTSAFAEGGFRRYAKLQQDVKSLKERNQRLAEENARLRREAEALRTDPAAMERVAREELGFVKPGELVFNLSEPAP